MGVEYYKGKPIPLFESVKFKKETGYGLSASEDWKSYLLYEFKDHSVVPRLKINVKEGTVLELELDSEDKFNVHIFDKEGNDKGISQLPI